MWDAKVKIGNMINVGKSKRGARHIIPITEGTFAGPNIKGKLLPGGTIAIGLLGYAKSV